VIEYEPHHWCVESKALKLYLGSFRQTGEFHEACTARITQDLIDLLAPKWIRVQGQFTPRGGIKFWPTCEYTNPAFMVDEVTLQKAIRNSAFDPNETPEQRAARFAGYDTSSED